MRIFWQAVPVGLVLLVNASFGNELNHTSWKGRGASVAAYAGTFSVLYSRASADGTDLYFRLRADRQEEVRVNDIPGEVRDGGENAPILLADAKRRSFYAIWNAVDPRRPLANDVRFARWTVGDKEWSPSVTLNDDKAASMHTFQSAALGPDGVIYTAWLDWREQPVGKPGDYPGGGLKTRHVNIADSVSLYLVRSTDGGRSFERNVRVAGNVCPCCRVALGFSQGKVLAAWRSVDENSIRDITVATSPDGGRTWSEPRVAIRDGWKINGCPHVGPAFATSGKTTWLAWVTRTKQRSGVFVTSTADGGQTFSPVQELSTGIRRATHPQLASSDSTVVAVFQGSLSPEAGEEHESSHGHSGPPPAAMIFLSSLQPDNTWSKPAPVSSGTRSATYPFAGVGPDNNVAVSWTEIHQDASTGQLSRQTLRDPQ